MAAHLFIVVESVEGRLALTPALSPEEREISRTASGRFAVRGYTLLLRDSTTIKNCALLEGQCGVKETWFSLAPLRLEGLSMRLHDESSGRMT